MGISEATFYNWKNKFGGLGVSELRRLRQLEKKNSKLKQFVADLGLDKQMIQDVLKKALVPSQLWGLAIELREQYQVFKRKACHIVMLYRSDWYYTPQLVFSVRTRELIL